MKVVIDIDDNLYTRLFDNGKTKALDISKACTAIRKGVPLPKGHGRLIDADAEAEKWGLDKATKYGNETAEQQHFSYSTMKMYEIADILDDADVIIEADKEAEDGTN